MIEFRALIAVAVGGAFGAMSRYLIAVITAYYITKAFPLGTLLVNVLGSFIIGVLSQLFFLKILNNQTYYLLGAVGFLGALTTFSSFSLETLQLYQVQGAYFAVGNIILNVVLCLLAVALGVHLTKLLM